MLFQRDQQIIQDCLQGFGGIAFSLELWCERDTNLGLFWIAFKHAKAAVADQFAARAKKYTDLIPPTCSARLNRGQASNVRLNDVDGFGAQDWKRATSGCLW